MSALEAGSAAPPIPGLSPADPTVVLFYKVTCPVCQMAAPAVEAFHRAYPGRIVGVGQDPAEKLEAFGRAFGMTFPVSPDPPPYELSDAYGVSAVPTAFLVHGGAVLQTVESWDRDGLNGLSRRLAELTGAAYEPISEPGDGLPPFRPG